MWRRTNTITSLVLLWIAVCGAAGAAAQQTDPLGSYLRERGLDDLYAEYLSARLEREAGETRVATARELAEVYIRLLESSDEAKGRERWASRASTLLRLVPEADSPDLQINVARAAYMQAEAIAERARLRLADPDEIVRAERILRDIVPQLVYIGQASHRRAELLENQLGRQLDRDDEDRVTTDLAEARRQRSFAFYFSGWACYYLSVLTEDPAFAEQALRHFGWLLNAGSGEPASIEGLQSGLLRFEHVARSAVGAGLACGRTGRIVEAQAWLDAVARETAVPTEIRAQIPARKAAVFAEGKLWRDLDTLARRRLSPESGEADPLFARLIAVLALDELAGAGGGRSSELLRRLADDAFGSLIAAGEIAQVADLARHYGPDRIRGEGFVPSYVRGLLALDAARAARDAGGNENAEAVVRARFVEAAETLQRAVDAPDAGGYAREAIQARFDAGAAWFEAGRPADALRALEAVWTAAEEAALREQALWLAVVALDEAVSAGRDDLRADRDRVAVLYLTTYSATERASLLAIRPGTAGLLTAEQAIDILLSTPAGSPTYTDARRRAAVLLYRQYRGASGTDATLAAERYMVLAEELLAADRAALRELSASAGRELAESIVVSCRRLADAALGVEPPSVDRARFALESIDRVAAFAGLDIGDIESELAFRRLQIALIEDDPQDRSRAMRSLETAGSDYLLIARRLVYRDAVNQWLDAPSAAGRAEAVVRAGLPVADDLTDDPRQTAVRLGVLDTVAQAAFDWWRRGGGTPALDAGLRASDALLEAGVGEAELLAQRAQMLAAADRRGDALEAWRRVLAAADPTSLRWFEARLESLRILAETDPTSAREAAAQFRALHPRLGPESLRPAFRDVLERIESGGG
ncbi:MAG: hypothetical protein ACTS22_04665 [Phycisphaerales bacterium]